MFVLPLADPSAGLPSDLRAVVADNTCTLPEASGSAPQEMDPTRENEVLFTYSVHWQVGDGGSSSPVLPDGVHLSSRSLVSVQASEVKWASRWDTYLTMSDVQIHWFSIVNSVVVVFFLSGKTFCSASVSQLSACSSSFCSSPPPPGPPSGILSMIIIRTLRKDIANYNREDDIVRPVSPPPGPPGLLSLSCMCVPRRTQWKSLGGRMSTETSSGLQSIP